MNKAVHKIWSSENFISCFPETAALVVPVLEELSLDAFILPRPNKQTKGRKRVSRMQKGDSQKPKSTAKKAKKYLTSLYESSLTTEDSENGIYEPDFAKSQSSEQISDDGSSDTSSHDGSDSDDDNCRFVIHADNDSDGITELAMEISDAEQLGKSSFPVNLVDNEYLSFLDYYFNDDEIM
jgi:hypothetical protein